MYRRSVASSWSRVTSGGTCRMSSSSAAPGQCRARRRASRRGRRRGRTGPELLGVLDEVDDAEDVHGVVGDDEGGGTE